jgi:hypothetical protein
MDPGHKERKISDQHSNAIQKQEENGSIKTTNNIGNKGRLRKEEKSEKKKRNTERMRAVADAGQQTRWGEEDRSRQSRSRIGVDGRRSAVNCAELGDSVPFCSRSCSSPRPSEARR